MDNPVIRRAYAELHSAVFLFGFTGILGRLISLQAGVLVWHRLWMTALMMYLLTRLSGSFRLLSKAETLRLSLFSLAITFHWLLFYQTIKVAGVSVAMICLSAIAFFSALLEPLILRKSLSKTHLFFSSLVIAGIWLMVGTQHSALNGILLGLAAAFFSALFTVLNKTVVHKYDVRLLTLYELSAGFVALSILLPLMNSYWPTGDFIPNASDWLYLFLLSSFCTVLAFSLSIKSLKVLSPFSVNLAINLEPVYGIALAFWLFNEYELFGPNFYWGAALIFLAVSGDILLTYLQNKTPQH
ncbi:MAG: DMT family transporter [Bacteroidia bacterium]|nr:DMT family transporter [Bacteroidia bacterium]